MARCRRPPWREPLSHRPPWHNAMDLHGVDLDRADLHGAVPRTSMALTSIAHTSMARTFTTVDPGHRGPSSRARIFTGGPPPQATPSATSRWPHRPADLHCHWPHRRTPHAGLIARQTFAAAGLTVGLLTLASSPVEPSPLPASPSASLCQPHRPADLRRRKPHRRPPRTDLITWRTFAIVGLTAGLLAPTSSPGGPSLAQASLPTSSRRPHRPADLHHRRPHHRPPRTGIIARRTRASPHELHHANLLASA